MPATTYQAGRIVFALASLWSAMPALVMAWIYKNDWDRLWPAFEDKDKQSIVPTLAERPEISPVYRRETYTIRLFAGNVRVTRGSGESHSWFGGSVHAYRPPPLEPHTPPTPVTPGYLRRNLLQIVFQPISRQFSGIDSWIEGSGTWIEGSGTWIEGSGTWFEGNPLVV